MHCTLSMEQHLIRQYESSLEAYIAEPFSAPASLAFFAARDDLAEFIRVDGAPAEDLSRGLRYTVTRNGCIKTESAYIGRFAAWAAWGMESIAPAFGRAG